VTPGEADVVRSLTSRLPPLLNTVYATASAGSAALLLVLLVVAGHYLDIENYGRFVYAIAVSTIVETVMDIGLAHVTVRAVARDRAAAPTLFRHVLGLKLVWVAIGLGLMAIVAPLLRSDPAVIRLCYLLGLSSAARSYFLTTRGFLQGMDRFDLEAAIVVADRVLLLAFGTAALALGYDVLGLGIAFVLARLVMFGGVTAVLRQLLGRTAPTFDRDVWRDLQAAALPLGLFMISLNLYSYIDTVILGAMRSNTDVGLYGAAYRIYEGLTYPPSIIASLVTPKLSYYFVHDRTRVRRLLTASLGGAAVLGFVLGGAAVLLARPLVTLLFGPAFEPAVAPLQILAAGALFVFCTWILHAAAIATNLDRRLFLTTIVGLGTNVALNVVFIRRWGISGAASATVIAEAVTVILLVAQLRRHLTALA
jgi:O-antigen/teichoic acid export membrane protein